MENSRPPADPDTRPVASGLIRRLAAAAYDTLLLCGVLFLAGLPLPTIPDDVRNSWVGQISVRVYLVSVCLLFFGWFWTHGGQTLGMRAWRVRVVARGGYPVKWSAAVLRFFGAILSWAALGAGFWSSLFRGDKLTWHDRLSDTRLVRVPKGRNR